MWYLCRASMQCVMWCSPSCLHRFITQSQCNNHCSRFWKSIPDENFHMHLKVPPFGAYKPPRSQGPMPWCQLISQLFLHFPYVPVKSSLQISGLQPSKPCWHSSNHLSCCPSSFSSTPTYHQNSHRYLSKPINTHQHCFRAFLATSMACVLAVRDSEHTYKCIPSPFFTNFCG